MVKNTNWIRFGILIGTLAGILFGLLMKAIEVLTGKLIYTLLLTVDFIPIIGSIQWGEFVEFIFHLILSIGITLLYIYANKQFPIQSFLQYLNRAFLFMLPFLPLYFILSLLAIREVADATDMTAFLYWVLAHIVFAYLLAIGNWIVRNKV
jgi:hypothetical protein